jgi:hypothetical protein
MMKSPAMRLLRALLTIVLAAGVHGTAEAQNVIRAGTTVNGTLAATDPVMRDGSHFVRWHFAGLAGQRIRVTLRSADFDAFLGFGHFDGDECVAHCRSDDDGGDGTDARLDVTITEDGTYDIIANSWGAAETGAYTLSVEVLPPPREPVTRPIELSQDVYGRLTEESATFEDGPFYDRYLYTARRGERISVSLRSDDFDAFLAVGRLVAGVWHELASDDDSGGGTDSFLELHIDEDGDLVIHAMSLRDLDTGAYLLLVEPAPAMRPEAEVTRPIRVGETITASLEAEDPRGADHVRYHLWIVRGEPGTSVTITMRSADFDAFLEWGRPSAEWSALYVDDDGAGGTDAQLEVTLGQPGEFAVRTRSYRGGTLGSYTLSVAPRS